MTDHAPQAPAAQLPAPPPPPTPRGGRAGLMLGALALLVAVGTAGGAGWLWWQDRPVLQAADARLQALQQQLESNRAELVTLQQQQGEQRTALRDVEASAQRQAGELGVLGERLSQLDRLARSERSDWRLAEAEYLLRMASHTLIYARDPVGSRQLLQSADTLLASLDDPGLYPARAALSEAHARLANLKPLDAEGTYLAIAALGGRVDALRALPELEAPDAEPLPVGVRPWYETLWHGIKQTLGQVLVVQKRHTELTPVLNADDEWRARSRVRLLLTQAQAALLGERAALYRQTLEEAAASLARDFAADPASTALAADMRALAERPVSLDVPDISAPVRALEEAIAARESLPAAAAAKGE